ncbi:MAG: DUF378 domain-containing protein [Firmicutes bacterium]|nr:DUF378 domain-containing protein [Bacillota bacterium]
MWKKVLNIIAFTILILGGLNWMLVGIFNLNLISTVFMGYRSPGSITMYVLVGLSALWLIISSIASNGRIQFVEDRHHHHGNA